MQKLNNAQKLVITVSILCALLIVAIGTLMYIRHIGDPVPVVMLLSIITIAMLWACWLMAS